MNNDRMIFKYQITDDNEGKLRMPKYSHIVSCQYQDGIITMWAIVDDTQELEDRQFDVYGTGWDIHFVGKNYIATLQDDKGFVWHVFEINMIK